MVVRIQFGQGARVKRRRRKNQRVALAFASFLTPAAVMAGALGIWGVAEGPQWASHFAINNGLFSHWQVWFAFAGLLQAGSHFLNRYGRPEDQPV
jgi:hypothetical protein